VHVVWTDAEDTAPLISDILYRRSINGGSTFPNIIINLSTNPESSAAPAIASTSNNVHVVWDNFLSGDNDILYRRSTDSGASFTEPIKNLSSNTGNSVEPAIAALDNNVHVTWSDDTPDNPGINNILYTRSLNGGSTFPNIIINLSDSTGPSIFPAVPVIGANLYVVWRESSEVVYRPSPDSGVTFDPTVTKVSPNSSAFPSIAVSAAAS
jgi:hypothetical protein